jgi:23S rRNA pseudouridine2605 synthase
MVFFTFAVYLLQMKKKTGFEKFAKGQSSGARKEQFRQEKRNFKKELTEQAERKKKELAQKAEGTARAPIAVERKAEDNMPLNKYIAHCGVCSRRDAVELIKTGKVLVNGEAVLEPGHKIKLNDKVTVGGKSVVPVKNLVYILLNKPKDYLTTTEDPQKRKTVLDLIKTATTERVYPVGRLDRNTSGVLLLTNDGDLSQKLTHPSSEIKKVYAVTLDKPLTKAHFEAIAKGTPLEDGIAPVDALAFTDSADKTQVGIEIHSGRNRIVRRIFEHYGYDVKGLDRVMFAGLTKKNVNRGKWRSLTEREVRELKFFGRGK